jgi:hypothetical protein
MGLSGMQSSAGHGGPRGSAHVCGEEASQGLPAARPEVFQMQTGGRPFPPFAICRLKGRVDSGAASHLAALFVFAAFLAYSIAMRKD